MYTNYSQLNMLGMGSSMGYQNFLGGGLGMGGFNIGGMLGGCNMFQSCDDSYNYDAMAGMAVGNVLVNCLFGFLGQAVSSRQAKKADSPEATLETLKNKQADLTKEVETKTSEYNTANQAYITAKDEYDTNHALIKDKTAADFADAQRICDLYNKKVTPDEGEKMPSKEEYNTAHDLLEAKDKDSTLKSAMEAAKAKMETAKEAKEKKEAELAAVEKEIGDIETQNKANTTDQILDKADGHGYQQTKIKELNSLFKVDGEGHETFFSDNVKSTHKDLRGAIAQYRLAQSDSEKQKWANRISIIWNHLDPEDQKNNKDIITGINAMRTNYPNLTFNNI